MDKKEIKSLIDYAVKRYAKQCNESQDIVLSFAYNGWIVDRPNPESEGRHKEVFPNIIDSIIHYDEEENLESCKNAQNLLWALLEDIYPYNKRRKYNVVIKIEKDGEIYDK